ncbi:MAG: hypothetical protein Q9P14_00245 [candidate division KSB1 bacterium]|nr:hypothetical protein [candidate division KSB1 bacterium]
MNSIMKNMALAFLTVLLIQACGSPEPAQLPQKRQFDPARSDGRAIAWADNVMQAVGAGDAFGKIRYIRFHFVLREKDTVRVDRAHWWNRQTDDYKIEWFDPMGNQYTVLLNLRTGQGEAWFNRKPVADSLQSRTLLQRAYASVINDTYWLLMPFKLNDPGVILSYEGETEVDGQKRIVIRLAFDNVGLTPQNQYRIYIDPETHLVRRWDFLKTPDAEPRPALWLDWQEWQGVKIARKRQFLQKPITITFEQVRLDTVVDASAFLPPDSPPEVTKK